MEASCQFYIAGDTLGFSTFGSFGLHLFWLVGAAVQELTSAARAEMRRHAAIDCFRYTPGSPFSP